MTKGLLLLIRISRNFAVFSFRVTYCQLTHRLAMLAILGVCMVGTKLATADDSIEQRVMPIVNLMNGYCMDCHNASDAKAGLDLELVAGKIKQSGALTETETLEKIVKRLRAREMPPADATRPDENASKAALTAIESILDLAAAKDPQPGRTDSIRRLNRTEYHHAIRDLLAMDVDVNAILPADESGHGFDNVTVGDLPPMLLSRYITAAQQISRLAVELASRLSFFLWSSIPDAELLSLAEKQQLREPEILRQQVLRMLGDGRAESLVTNFAAQWLYLRNLETFRPDMRLYPDFDDNLRMALRKETELRFQHILQDDRSVLELIDTDTTFLNERLAKHYGIPGVIGSQFRPVKLTDPNAHRGGLLRHGSILAVTSYATRTSPTVRGNWILANILGTPPPPPPPNVPSLKDKSETKSLTIRERMAEHRSNPACANCHNLMDPVGFSLENFDAVGRWRTLDDGHLVDASGGLPDGTPIKNFVELEESILKHPELFVGTLTEKLMTFALGRGIESYDGPAVRQVVRRSSEQNYRFSSLITNIVSSVPFQMRVVE